MKSCINPDGHDFTGYHCTYCGETNPPAEHKVETIDITPTWSGILPLLLELLQPKGLGQREFARKELEKMARVADKYVSLSMKEI